MRFATKEDVQEILSLYEVVIDTVNQSNIKLGWNIDIYPNKEFVEQAIQKKQMCVVEEENRIVAAAVVNHDMNEEYRDIAWKVTGPEERIATIHALATLPDCRGGKISQTLLKDIEEYCRSQNDAAIHLDVIDTNIPAYKLYLRNGYEEIDCIEMYYEVVGTRQFWMLERVL